MAGKNTQPSGRPTIRQAFSAVADDLDVPKDVDIKIVEVRIAGGGQIVYRLTPSDRGEQIGGVVSVD